MAVDWIINEKELPGDLDTPVTAFLKLKPLGARFLLETVESGTVLGRYSLIGLHPLVEVVCQDRTTELVTPDGRRFPVAQDQDPTLHLSRVLDLLRPCQDPAPGNILGGAVGYLAYEWVEWLEKVPVSRPAQGDAALARFLVPRSLVTFDHLTRRLTVRTMSLTVRTMSLTEGDLSLAEAPDDPLSTALRHALHLSRQTPEGEFDALVAALVSPRPPTPLEEVSAESELVGMPEPDQYRQWVEQAREEIQAGEIFQVVLSQRLVGPAHVPPFQLYRALRMLNPSPYLFFLDFDDTCLVGSSPEVLVKLEGPSAMVRPIAGTRPRGSDVAEDHRLAEDLLADEKEKAEHVMLVDLGRNDLGRVCEPGTVEVTDLMTVERYSHVMHIVSYVRGLLQKGLDRFDLLRAVFPAGTVSGAPKIRAMEIIQSLEQNRRGPYAGAVGYFAANGDMDLCITIRTVVYQGDQMILQAGAGIVADSDAEKEHQECHAKMRVLREALRLAREELL